MFSKLVFLTFLILGLVSTANAACYGHKEKFLAKKLLIRHPELSQELEKDSKGARVWNIRDFVCHPRHLRKIDEDEIRLSIDRYFAQDIWKPEVEESEKYGLSQERVLIAMDDLREKKGPTAAEMHKRPAP